MAGLSFSNDGISGQNLVDHINQKVVPGVYIGDGRADRFIDLGFEPDWVFVSSIYGQRYVATHHFQDYTDMPNMTGLSVKDGNQVYGRIVEISGDGFYVHDDNTTPGNKELISYDRLTNHNGCTYMFIAGVGDFIKIEN